MYPAMSARDLHLSLQAAAAVPCNLNWRVEDGCLRVASWNAQGERFTLGLWGSGGGLAADAGGLPFPGYSSLAPCCAGMVAAHV